MYEALYPQCFPSECGKNRQATRAGFEPMTYLTKTHDS